MRLRRAETADIPELARLYRETVAAIAPSRYSPTQTQAWASFADDPDFRHFITEATTWVATDETGILGFAGLHPSGRISAVYVRCDRIRRGIGSQLLQTLLHEARRLQLARLYAEASEFSLGLFLKFGFRITGLETVERQGVEFRRYLVEWRG